ncbi:MAG: GNAT family N-acetyltransferase [Opitutales bacterium]|nr:GNAT family N-acetyltransferase [Opitutales bacterium]
MKISINDGVTTKIIEDVERLADSWHEKYETSKGIQYGFKKFFITAEKDDETIGILIGYTAFSEVYIDDLVVHEKFRRQGVGRKLLQKLEEYFDGQNYSNISLVTNEFQAPDFYKKCGYSLEFVRKNERFPSFSKYFFIKWLK